jgi:hypothetical protein
MINIFIFLRDKNTILKFKVENMDYEKILTRINVKNLS